jgi:hypothetical protein
MMTFDEFQRAQPVEVQSVDRALDDLVRSYGRLRLVLALLTPRRRAAVPALPLDDRMRADIGLPPVMERATVAGAAFHLLR